MNRTNRTLSANLNRLNLGTRSLVPNTNECNSKQTQRVRHAHGFAMRAGMFVSSDPSIQTWSIRIGISSIPGSSPVAPWPVPGLVVRPPVADPATAPCAHANRPVERASLGRAYQGQPQAHPDKGGAKHGCKSLQDLRLRQGKATGRDADRATRAAAAARFAAAAG